MPTTLPASRKFFASCLSVPICAMIVRGTKIRALHEEPQTWSHLSFFGSNVQLELFPFCAAFEPFFHTWNKVLGTVKVVKWVSSLAGIQYITLAVTQRIMDSCYFVFCNIHKSWSLARFTIDFFST